MDDLRHVRAGPSRQRGQHALVQRDQPGRRHRARDRAPGQLVPERDPAARHRQQAPLLGEREDRGGVRGQALHERRGQPGLERGRHHRQLLQHVLGHRVQPPDAGQHGVRDGRRHPLAGRRDQQFVHEERVPRRQLEELSRIQRAVPAELAHRAGGQPAQRQPPHPVAAGRLAEQAVQRVLAAQLVVAVGEDEHRGQPGDPPGEVAQRVQGGVVGPVHVLDDQDPRVVRPVQFGAQRGQQPVPVAAVGHRLAEFRPDAADQVPERAQRPRGGQVVAVANQHPALGGQLRPHGVDQA